MNNPYEILHLQEDATYDQIKERYRHLTRSLHPDKQPLQNYQASKKLFEQVDQAYKSIASPLRRFLFKEYGLPALKVLDQMPGEFHEFDNQELSHQQTERLKQLMIYLLYERQACFEMDKTKFVTKSLINVTKTIKTKRTNVKKNTKRNMNLPELQNASFEYQMVLPEVCSFSNSISLSHFTNNIKTDPKYSLMTTLSSVRRFYTSYMLAILTTVSADDTNIEIGLDKICQNNLHLKFTPISFHNLNFGKPKFGIQKGFNKFNFSAITDLENFNFDFIENSQQRLSKSLKLYMEKGSLAVVPKLQFQLTPNLRLFAQLSTGISYNSQQNNMTLRPSLLYGYKLTLHEDLKVQLSSSIGSPNYYQISFINSKFRASIPFITGDEEQVKFQACKVLVFLAVYFFHRLYHKRLRQNEKQKLKVMKEQQNRLKEQKRQLTMQISYLEMPAAEKKDREIKYNGLVILRALLGEQYKIKTIERRISKLFLAQEFNQLPDEVQDITVLIQNEVVGSQILSYDLQQLLKYNPCIFDSYRPYIMLFYSERGDYKTKVIQCKGKLSLGGFCWQYNTASYKIKNLVRKTIEYFLG